MSFQNTPNKFGSLTKFLHWLIFILFVTQYALVYRRGYLPEESTEKLQYLMLHKSFGVILLGLAVFMILWRHAGTRPSYISMNVVEKLLAKLTHFLLYLTMLIMPLSGIGMSLYAGYSVSVFGLALPLTLTKNEALGNALYQTHVWTSYIVLALAALHILAALYHHFLRRDEVLKRMLPSI
jgi:cytochrome b561